MGFTGVISPVWLLNTEDEEVSFGPQKRTIQTPFTSGDMTGRLGLYKRDILHSTYVSYVYASLTHLIHLCHSHHGPRHPARLGFWSFLLFKWFQTEKSLRR